MITSADRTLIFNDTIDYYESVGLYVVSAQDKVRWFGNFPGEASPRQVSLSASPMGTSGSDSALDVIVKGLVKGITDYYSVSAIGLSGFGLAVENGLSASNTKIGIFYDPTNLKINDVGQITTIQDLTSASSPTFQTINFPNLTNGQIIILSGGQLVTSAINLQANQNHSTLLSLDSDDHTQYIISNPLSDSRNNVSANSDRKLLTLIGSVNQTKNYLDVLDSSLGELFTVSANGDIKTVGNLTLSGVGKNISFSDFSNHEISSLGYLRILTYYMVLETTTQGITLKPQGTPTLSVDPDSVTVVYLSGSGNRLAYLDSTGKINATDIIRWSGSNVIIPSLSGTGDRYVTVANDGTLRYTSASLDSVSGTGSGTVNTISKFVTSASLGDSLISENGSTIIINGDLKVGTLTGLLSGANGTLVVAPTLPISVGGTNNTSYNGAYFVWYNGSSLVSSPFTSGSFLTSANGTINTISKFGSANSLVNSSIVDNGTSVIISEPVILTNTLNVSGISRFAGQTYFISSATFQNDVSLNYSTANQMIFANSLNVLSSSPALMFNGSFFLVTIPINVSGLASFADDIILNGLAKNIVFINGSSSHILSAGNTLKIISEYALTIETTTQDIIFKPSGTTHLTLTSSYLSAYDNLVMTDSAFRLNYLAGIGDRLIYADAFGSLKNSGLATSAIALVSPLGTQDYLTKFGSDSRTIKNSNLKEITEGLQYQVSNPLSETYLDVSNTGTGSSTSVVLYLSTGGTGSNSYAGISYTIPNVTWITGVVASTSAFYVSYGGNINSNRYFQIESTGFASLLNGLAVYGPLSATGNINFNSLSGSSTRSLGVDAFGNLTVVGTTSANISGTGTVGKIAKFVTTNSVGDSVMSEVSGNIIFSSNISDNTAFTSAVYNADRNALPYFIGRDGSSIKYVLHPSGFTVNPISYFNNVIIVSSNISAVSLNTTSDLFFAGEKIQIGGVTGNAVINANASMFFNIDTDGNSTGEGFIWGKDVPTISSTRLMSLNEVGLLTIENALNVSGALASVGNVATNSFFWAFGTGNPGSTDKRYLYLDHTGSLARIIVDKGGAGTYTGLSFYVGGSEVINFTVGGLTYINTGAQIIGTLNVSGSSYIAASTGNQVIYTDSSNAMKSSSTLSFDGTNLGIGVASSAAFLHVNATTDTGNSRLRITMPSASSSLYSKALFIESQGSDYSGYLFHITTPAGYVNATNGRYLRIENTAGLTLDVGRHTVGIGVSRSVNSGLYIGTSAFDDSLTVNHGLNSSPTFPTYSTSQGMAILAKVRLANSLNLGNAYGLFIDAPFMGTSSILTNNYGIYVEDLTQGGSNNYAIYTGSGHVRLGDRIFGSSSLNVSGAFDVVGRTLLRNVVSIGTDYTGGDASLVVFRDNPGMSGPNQYGIIIAPRFSSAATNVATAGYFSVNLANNNFNVNTARSIHIVNPDKGSGGATISTNYGLYMDSQTAGSTNYAIYTNAGIVRFGEYVGSSTRVLGIDASGNLTTVGSVSSSVSGTGTVGRIAKFATANSVGDSLMYEVSPGIINTGSLNVSGDSSFVSSIAIGTNQQEFYDLNASAGLAIWNSNLRGASQWGAHIKPTFSPKTSAGFATVIQAWTTTSAVPAANSYNIPNSYSIYVEVPSLGTNSTITNHYGVYIADQTYGSDITNAYALYTGSGRVVFGDHVQLNASGKNLIFSHSSDHTISASTTLNIDTGRDLTLKTTTDSIILKPSNTSTLTVTINSVKVHYLSGAGTRFVSVTSTGVLGDSGVLTSSVVGGTGTIDYYAKFSATSTIANALLKDETDGVLLSKNASATATYLDILNSAPDSLSTSYVRVKTMGTGSHVFSQTQYAIGENVNWSTGTLYNTSAYYISSGTDIESNVYMRFSPNGVVSIGNLGGDGVGKLIVNGAIGSNGNKFYTNVAYTGGMFTAEATGTAHFQGNDGATVMSRFVSTAHSNPYNYLCAKLVIGDDADPSSSNVLLRLKRSGNSVWMDIDKSSTSYENGIAFRENGSSRFYVYMDDNSNNYFQIQSSNASGETDAAPRIRLANTTKDMWLAASGGKIRIGDTTTPSYMLDVGGEARFTNTIYHEGNYGFTGHDHYIFGENTSRALYLTPTTAYNSSYGAAIGLYGKDYNSGNLELYCYSSGGSINLYGPITASKSVALAASVSTTTTGHTLDSSEYTYVVRCNGTKIVALPAASGCLGRIHNVIAEGSTTYVNIVTTSPDTIGWGVIPGSITGFTFPVTLTTIQYSGFTFQAIESGKWEVIGTVICN